MKGHGGNIYGASKRFSIPPGDIIDFSANINPLGMHWNTKELLAGAYEFLADYPDPDCRELTDRISACYAVHKKNILCGNGSVSLIYLAVRALNFKKAVIVQPGFSEYESALKGTGCSIKHLLGREKRGFKVETERIVEASKNVDCLFLSSPNNPAGYVYTGGELKKISSACRKNKTFLFIDECFIDFMENHNRKSLLSKTAKNPYILVLRSMTKFYAIPGIRLGFIAAHRAIIKKMKKYRDPWSVNSLAQQIGKVIIGDPIYGTETRRLVAAEREYLLSELDEIEEIKVFPSTVNYLLCKIRSGKTAKMLSQFLIMYNILIRNCSNYRGLSGSFFRIAVKGHKENELLAQGLKRFFSKDIL